MHCVEKDFEAMSELRKEGCDLLAMSAVGKRFGHITRALLSLTSVFSPINLSWSQRIWDFLGCGNSSAKMGRVLDSWSVYILKRCILQ